MIAACALIPRHAGDAVQWPSATKGPKMSSPDNTPDALKAHLTVAAEDLCKELAAAQTVEAASDAVDRFSEYARRLLDGLEE